MPALKTGLRFILLLVLLKACVDPYFPDIKDSQVSLVVEALITDRPGWQSIYLSRSSPLNDTSVFPETNAFVSVSNDLGRVYDFQEEEPGVYSIVMDEADLVPGTAYWLNIVTSDGEVYESDPELLMDPCPPIDSVYWEYESSSTSDRNELINGIRFYMDMEAEENQARNFRLELEETWLYYAANLIDYYYDGILQKWEDPYSLNSCWFTEGLNTIYTATTRATESNTISGLPLNYVSEQSHRLLSRYSLRVRQYTLSDVAYDYWEQVQEQNQESGGIYEKQLDYISGNMHNPDRPEERVLGYFNVSSVSEKRIFVSGIKEFHYPPINCTLDTIMAPEYRPIWMTVPFYMISFNPMRLGPPYGVGINLCFDCRNGGGTIEEPDFWE